MGDPPQRLQPPRITTIEFDGDRLDATILVGDGVAIPVRTMCSALSLDLERQSEQLRSHPVLTAGLRIVNVRIGNRVQSVAALLHTYIPFWLATINPAQVNEQQRPKLIRYQQELVDILAQLFYGDVTRLAPVSTDPAVLALQHQVDVALRELRVTRDALLAAQRRTDETVSSLTDIVAELQDVVRINAAQAEYIQRAIKRLAGRLYQRRKQGTPQASEENLYQRLFGQYRIDLGVPRYDALPMKRYDEAIAWLARKAAELLPDEPDALPPHQEQLL